MKRTPCLTFGRRGGSTYLIQSLTYHAACAVLARIMVLNALAQIVNLRLRP